MVQSLAFVGIFWLLRGFLALTMFLSTGEGFRVESATNLKVWGCAYADDVLIDEDEHRVEDLDLSLGV
jgi:hypothetical protein